MLIYGIALLAGIVTAISPCAYPVLPIVFAGGVAGSERRPFAIIAGLVTTFLVSLLALTWIVDQLGLPQDLLRNISIGLLFLAAATLIIPQLGRAVERPLARLSRRRGGDLGGGFLLGAALGLVFAPCAGLVLTAVVGETASLSGFRRFGVALAYAIGAGATLLLIAILARRGIQRLRAVNVNRLRMGLGVVIGLATLGIAFNLDTTLQKKLPDYTSGLQRAIGEKSCYARKHLGQRCLPSQHSSDAAASSLPDYGAAPNFTGISDWINSKPLTTRKLRGKVVLVDFWTYSCINCLRTLPHLKAWYAAYHKAGLEIVGVHTPEFTFEHVPSNVRKAVKELGVRYPVAIDNDAATWKAYENSAWPTEYLVDRQGHVREIAEGEGNYDGTEMKIRELLGKSSNMLVAAVPDKTPSHFRMTPESYLGFLRLDRYAGAHIEPGKFATYHFPLSMPPDSLAYAGRWRVDPERIIAGPGAKLRLLFTAQNVYIVLAGHGKLGVFVDGQHVKTIPVSGLSRLYTVLSYPQERENHLLELHFTPGVSAYSFTFG
jgi:cytochrome c biogenesis protein CcdA/thiol-disulfide isomerase/thioredoxin